ncbi:MAG TPA: hypothetical protein VNZ43_03165 [Sphingomonadaceae bacterium]|jgi:hypothetical protein|nr:hypothetical protein [Sphingomonadaceae bacterium]
MITKRMVFAARMVLGIFYLLSGLNWFFGFIPLLPYVGMPTDLPIKHAVVSEMIATGWMFQSAKIVEVAFGLSMVTNRAVPAMLLAALPVAFLTFMLDAMILGDLWAWIQGAESGAQLWAAIYDMTVGGLCVLLVHLWLVWCYADYYRPMLVWRSKPDEPSTAGAGKMLRFVFIGFGIFSITLQAWNLYLFFSMIGARR